LEFTISNLSNEDVTINTITDTGTFPSANPWEIENFTLQLPYILEAGSELTFNVIVSLPVENPVRDIVTDILTIDSEVGIFDITLNFDTALNVNAGNNLVVNRSELIGNYPNPFNPSTTISYNLVQDADVTISIYNLKGQLIKTLVNQHQTAGLQEVIWSGKDSNGRSAGSGIYFTKLKSGVIEQTKKMILLK